MLENRRVRCAHSILLLRMETRYACNKQRFRALYYTWRTLSLEMLRGSFSAFSLVRLTFSYIYPLFVLIKGSLFVHTRCYISNSVLFNNISVNLLCSVFIGFIGPKILPKCLPYYSIYIYIYISSLLFQLSSRFELICYSIN